MQIRGRKDERTDGIRGLSSSEDTTTEEKVEEGLQIDKLEGGVTVKEELTLCSRWTWV